MDIFAKNIVMERILIHLKVKLSIIFTLKDPRLRIFFMRFYNILSL